MKLARTVKIMDIIKYHIVSNYKTDEWAFIAEISTFLQPLLPALRYRLDS